MNISEKYESEIKAEVDKYKSSLILGKYIPLGAWGILVASIIIIIAVVAILMNRDGNYLSNSISDGTAAIIFGGIILVASLVGLYCHYKIPKKSVIVESGGKTYKVPGLPDYYYAKEAELDYAHEKLENKQRQRSEKTRLELEYKERVERQKEQKHAVNELRRQLVDAERDRLAAKK